MSTLRIQHGEILVMKRELSQDVTIIGRNPDCDIVLQDPAISQEHVRIVEINGEYLLQDMGSRNGVYVNGLKINKTVLRDLDVIEIGAHSLKFVAETSLKSSFHTDTILAFQKMGTPVLKIVAGRHAGHEFVLDNDSSIIGSTENNRDSALLQVRDSGVFITHLGGQFPKINQRRVDDLPVRLGNLDALEIGGVAMTLFFQTETADIAEQDNAVIIVDDFRDLKLGFGEAAAAASSFKDSALDMDFGFHDTVSGLPDLPTQQAYNPVVASPKIKPPKFALVA